VISYWGHIKYYSAYIPQIRRIYELETQCQAERAPNFPAGKAQQTRIINDVCTDFSWDPISLFALFRTCRIFVYIIAGVNRRSVYRIFNELRKHLGFRIYSFASSLYIMGKKWSRNDLPTYCQRIYFVADRSNCGWI